MEDLEEEQEEEREATGEAEADIDSEMEVEDEGVKKEVIPVWTDLTASVMMMMMRMMIKRPHLMLFGEIVPCDPSRPCRSCFVALH